MFFSFCFKDNSLSVHHKAITLIEVRVSNGFISCPTIDDSKSTKENSLVKLFQMHVRKDLRYIKKINYLCKHKSKTFQKVEYEKYFHDR